jgi:hypothetical protein
MWTAVVQAKNPHWPSKAINKSNAVSIFSGEVKSLIQLPLSMHIKSHLLPSQPMKYRFCEFACLCANASRCRLNWTSIFARSRPLGLVMTRTLLQVKQPMTQ